MIVQNGLSGNYGVLVLGMAAIVFILVLYIGISGKRFEELERDYTKLNERYKKLSEEIDDLFGLVNVIDEAQDQIDEKITKHIMPDDRDELKEDSDDIHLIDSEEYLFGEYKKMDLYYNKKDDTLRYVGKDSFYETCYILHPSKIIGDGLNFFGFRSGSDKIVYVRNHALKIDFMIRLDEPMERPGCITIDEKIQVELLKEDEPVKSNESCIKSVNGHYEVYVNGEFLCSADTISEAAQELENALAEEREEEC